MSAAAQQSSEPAIGGFAGGCSARVISDTHAPYWVKSTRAGADGRMTIVDGKDLEQPIAEACAAVKWDCGCPDIYFCPQSKEIECPRHSGFDVCCERPDLHVAVR